jgi:hypothetical protein
MRKYVDYLVAVAILGGFMGVVSSMGSNMLACIGGSCLLWACLLAPMLIDEKG